MATLMLRLDSGEIYEYDTKGNFRYVELESDYINEEEFVKDDLTYYVAIETISMVGTRQGKAFKTMIKRAFTQAMKTNFYDIDIYDKYKGNLMLRFIGRSEWITIENSFGEVIFNMDNRTKDVLYTQNDSRNFFLTLLKELAVAREREASGKAKVRPKRDILVDKYGQDFLDKENYLLKYYKKIEYKNLSADDHYKLLTYIAESHRYMTKVMNLDVYPKLNYLELEKPLERNWGYFYHDWGIKIRLLDEHPVHLLSLYAHEYGHFIHRYLTNRGTHKEFLHNDAIFKKMVTELRRGETIARIRNKKEWRDTYKKYMLKEVEIIARAFEFYCLSQYLKKGMIPTLEHLKDFKNETMYSDEELKIFTKYMVKLKI